MRISEEYYSGLLKTAESLARNEKLFLKDFAVIPVGIGAEHLLQELFEELKSVDEINRGYLSNEYRGFLKKKEYTHSRNKNTYLTFFGWIEFYRYRGIFGMLEDAYGWKFDRFNSQTLHSIREKRNLYHSHFEDRDVMRSLSSNMCEAFNEILVETHRISQPTAMVFRNQLQNQRASELALMPSERELVRRQVDDILRLNPADENLLFLRAYLLRGEKTALDDIEKILRLNPNHSEAKTEQNRYKNYHTAEKPSNQQSNHFNLTQTEVNINQRNFFVFNGRLGIVAVVLTIVLFILLSNSQNDSYKADLHQLQTTVDTQSEQLENVENELEEKDAKVEALEAGFQQLQTTVKTQPEQFAESVSDQENNDALTPNLGIEGKTDTQHTAQGESLAGYFEALLPILAMGIIGVYIFLLVARWILIKIVKPRLWMLIEIVLPPLTTWLISHISLTRLLKSFIDWLLQYIKESVSGLFRR